MKIKNLIICCDNCTRRYDYSLRSKCFPNLDALNCDDFNLKIDNLTKEQLIYLAQFSIKDYILKIRNAKHLNSCSTCSHAHEKGFCLPRIKGLGCKYYNGLLTGVNDNENNR